MPPRACHSVPLFLAAVCGGRECPSASAQWGRAFCGVAQAAPPSLHNALRPGAAGVCLTSASVPDPRSPWAAPAGSPRHTSRWPRPPRRVRAAAADFLGQRRIGAPLPASVWPSTAALRPASARDRRPAGRRPSTAARGSTGGQGNRIMFVPRFLTDSCDPNLPASVWQRSPPSPRSLAAIDSMPACA
jgi:hypothetical protein